MNSPRDENAEAMANFRQVSEEAFSTSDFDEYLEYHVNRAISEVKSKPTTDFAPRVILHLYGNGGQQASICYLHGMSSADDKRSYLREIGANAAREGVQGVAAFLISEAWAKKLSSKEEAREFSENKTKVSECEDKSEVLICVGQTIDGRSNLGTVSIDRTPERQILICGKEFSRSAESNRAQSDNLLTSFWTGYMNVMNKK